MKSDGRCGIIDGQHRAASILLLAQAEKNDLSKRDILVEVFDVQTEKGKVVLSGSPSISLIFLFILI